MTEQVLDGSLFGPDSACYGCAPAHPNGFRLRFEIEGDDVVTRFTPGQHHQGPPSIMHGGLVAALADEIAAWTLIGQLDKFGFTAKMAGTLKRPVRVGTEVEGRGRIERAGTRVVVVAVELRQGEVLNYEGLLHFVLVDEAGAEAILGGPLPDGWRRFGR